MTSVPVEPRDPITALLTAALGGDQPSTEALRALAEITDDSAPAVRAARRAVDVLDQLPALPTGQSAGERPSWPRVVAYTDQLRARYRDELPRHGHPEVSPGRRPHVGQAWMFGVSTWPTVGARVVVWSERPPSSAPRDPREATVDHVAGRTFTVAGIETTFNRSTGRSRPVRHGSGAFATETYIAVDADSDRAREVVTTAVRRDRDAEATRAVHAWLAENSHTNRRAAIEALQALDDL